MIVYHGSTVEIVKLDLKYSKNNLFLVSRQ